jgi:acyl dehydratase
MIRATYNKRDAIIYAIGIGSNDLKYVYEHHPEFQPLPTILLALTLKGDATDTQAFPPPCLPVSDIAIAGPVLDGERFLEIYRPLGAPADFRMSSVLRAKVAKRTGLVTQTETQLIDTSGAIVARVFSNTFYVGATGNSTSDQPLQLTRPIPNNARPDFEIDTTTSVNQSVIYRLSGDYNPLHIDPDVASAFGYSRPLTHGLCTLGIATRILIEKLMANDASRLRKLGCRFSKPTYPGNTLRIQIWRGCNGAAHFRVVDNETQQVIVDNGHVEWSVSTHSSKL